MFHSLKVQKFKVGGKEIHRPAVWSILMRVPIQVLRRSTSAQTTVFRILCVLTEGVCHDWLGSHHHKVAPLNAASPWNRPDRIWLGTNSHPPLSHGIQAVWSPELTKLRRRLKARKATRSYREWLREKDPDTLRARNRRSNEARKKGPDLDESLKKLATQSNQIRVIKYFEDDPVKFMAHLLKWRGVPVEDQVAIINADKRPLLDREIAHTMTHGEYIRFFKVIDNKYYNAKKAFLRKPRAENGRRPAVAANANAPTHSKNADDKPKEGRLPCPVPGCPKAARGFTLRSSVITHLVEVHKMASKEARDLVPVTTKSSGRFKCHVEGCKQAKSGFSSGNSLRRHLMGVQGHRLSKEEAEAAVAVYSLRKEGPHKCFLKSCPEAKIGFTAVHRLRAHLENAHKFSKEQVRQLVPVAKQGDSATKMALQRTLDIPKMEALAEQFERGVGTADTGSGAQGSAYEEDTDAETTNIIQDGAESGSPEASEAEGMDIDEVVSVQDEPRSGQPFVRLKLKSRSRPRLLCLEEERKGAVLGSKSGMGTGKTFTRFNLKSRGRPGLVCLDQLRSSKVVKPRSGRVQEKRRSLKQLSLSDWVS